MGENQSARAVTLTLIQMESNTAYFSSASDSEKKNNSNITTKIKTDKVNNCYEYCFQPPTPPSGKSTISVMLTSIFRNLNH